MLGQQLLYNQLQPENTGDAETDKAITRPHQTAHDVFRNSGNVILIPLVSTTETSHFCVYSHILLAGIKTQLKAGAILQQ